MRSARSGPSLVIALGLALALARSTRVNSALRAAFFLPVLIPLVAAASLFLFIFLPNVGLLDYYLGRCLANPPNWLGDPDIALYSIMALTVWKNAGYYMLFFLAGLQAVPDEAYEAAYLEGATPLQRLRLHHAALPQAHHRLRRRHRAAQCRHAGRPRLRADQGRPVGLHQPAAVLRLPAGGRELRHRQGLGGDADLARPADRHHGAARCGTLERSFGGRR